MRKISYLLALGTSAVMALSGCQKSQESAVQPAAISADVTAQVKALGFGTSDLKAVEGGYLVEGDIFLTPDLLASKTKYSMLRVGADEQYRTTNIVTGLPRHITISVSTSLPSAYVTAVDEMVNRYNNQNLQLTFERVTSGGNIQMVPSKNGAQYLASSGFPTSAGDPYNQVLVNAKAIGTSNPTTYIASILAHEVGHCIGFRHTDYTNRAYSCGGTATNEGASTVGAIQIPGTPAGPDPNSWMLACVGSGQNRPFNTNDVTALNALY
jgi:hypothetical protein